MQLQAKKRKKKEDTACVHCTPAQSEFRFPSNITEKEITIKQNALIALLQVVPLINSAAPPISKPWKSGGVKTQQRYNSEHLSPRSPLYELSLGYSLKTLGQRQAGRLAQRGRAGVLPGCEQITPDHERKVESLRRSDKTARRKMKTPMVKVSAA